MSRETQIREIEQTLHDIDVSIRWLATAAALYDVGMRLGYRDFALAAIRTALTAPEPAGAKPDGEQEPHCPKCGGLFCACVHPPREPTKPTSAPERRWVVQRKSDGAFRDVPTAWTMSLEAATKMLSRIDALEVALLMPEICLIRAVVRQPGRRRWEACTQEQRSGSFIERWARGESVPVREIAPAPDGPWILEQAP